MTLVSIDDNHIKVRETLKGILIVYAATQKTIVDNYTERNYSYTPITCLLTFSGSYAKKLIFIYRCKPLILYANH